MWPGGLVLRLPAAQSGTQDAEREPRGRPAGERWMPEMAVVTSFPVRSHHREVPSPLLLATGRGGGVHAMAAREHTKHNHSVGRVRNQGEPADESKSFGQTRHVDGHARDNPAGRGDANPH